MLTALDLGSSVKHSWYTGPLTGELLYELQAVLVQAINHRARPAGL